MRPYPTSGRDTPKARSSSPCEALRGSTLGAKGRGATVDLRRLRLPSRPDTSAMPSSRIRRAMRLRETKTHI